MAHTVVPRPPLLAEADSLGAAGEHPFFALICRNEHAEQGRPPPHFCLSRRDSGPKESDIKGQNFDAAKCQRSVGPNPGQHVNWGEKIFFTKFIFFSPGENFSTY